MVNAFSLYLFPVGDQHPGAIVTVHAAYRLIRLCKVCILDSVAGKSSVYLKTD